MRPVSIAALGLTLLAACRSAAPAPLPGPPDVRLEFEGNVAFSNVELLAVAHEELAAERGTTTKEADIDDTAYALESFYVRQGFPFAEIAYEFESFPEEPARARFLITEGPRTALVTVEVLGNAFFSDEELAGLFPEGGVFVRGQLEAAASSLESLYRLSGFLRARVAAPVIEFEDQNRRARAAVQVNEGQRFFLRAVELEGAELPVGSGDLRRLVEELNDAPFTPHLAYEVRARLTERFAQAGYPDCKVTVETLLDEESGDVRLRVEVAPGVKVTISALRFEGLVGSDPKRLRKLIPLKAGDVYDAAKARQGSLALYEAGMFESVRIELAAGSEPMRELVVTVQEAVSVDFYIEPGWGSYEQLRLRAGVIERNLFGTGRRLNVDAVVSNVYQGLSLNLVDPWIFGPNYDGLSSIFARHREEPSYTVTEYGINFGIGRSWSPGLRTTAFYQYLKTELDDVDVAGNVPPELLQNVDISSVALDVLHDDSDAPFYPTRGGREYFSFQVASEVIGSEIDFLAPSLQAARYFPLSGRTILAASFKTGLVIPYGQTDVIPIQLRQFNGGENTVRSFKEDELGPKDTDGDPVGGETFTAVSAELRHELIDSFSGAVFVDAGNVLLDYTDYFGLDDYSFGIGIGLRYLLPIGPLRLDVAWNPDPGPFDERWVAHLSVGLPY